MRKFRLNRDRDEPASGPNFPIGGKNEAAGAAVAAVLADE